MQAVFIAYSIPQCPMAATRLTASGDRWQVCSWSVLFFGAKEMKETKRNETKRNKTKQNKTKQAGSFQNHAAASALKPEFSSLFRECLQHFYLALISKYWAS